MLCLLPIELCQFSHSHVTDTLFICFRTLLIRQMPRGTLTFVTLGINIHILLVINYMTLIYGLYSYVLFLSFPSLNIKIEMPVNIRSSLLDIMINIHKPSCNIFLVNKKLSWYYHIDQTIIYTNKQAWENEFSWMMIHFCLEIWTNQKLQLQTRLKTKMC